MIKNLFRLAFRSLKNDLKYSLINISGLSIGITSSLLLFLFIREELSYDRHHEKADRIFRINSHVDEAGEIMKWSTTQFILAPTLKSDFPEVENTVRFVIPETSAFGVRGNLFQEKRFFYADSTIFDVFSNRFIEGDPKTALKNPGSLVLTKSMAKKHFGKTSEVLGLYLQNGKGKNFKITGLIEDVPSNSHLRYEGLMSISSLGANFSNNWGSLDFYTYVLLKPNVSAAEFEKKLIPMYEKYLEKIYSQFNITIQYLVIPITDIHLKSDYQSEPEEIGSVTYIYIFSAVAIFLIIVSCINYINLATARFSKRAMEIAISKIAGSGRSQIVAWLMFESLIIATIAVITSLLLIFLLLPYFNDLAGKSLSIQGLFTPGSITLIIGLIFVIAILSGSYPAFFLSGLKPLKILKGRVSTSISNVLFRRILVVVQFATAIAMLICTFVIYRQMSFLRDKDLGFSKENVLSVKLDPDEDPTGPIEFLKTELKKRPDVLSASTSWTPPGGTEEGRTIFSIETEKGFVERGLMLYGIDEDYLNTLNIQLVKGRNFLPSSRSDENSSILVNETMVKSFGWNEPIGKIIRSPGDTSRSFEVIGVVKDFHQKSLYNPIEPLMLLYRRGSVCIQIKMDGKNIQTTTEFIGGLWKKLFPGKTFNYSFLDQDLNSQYEADRKRGIVFRIFSILAIVITSLGLLGLITFITEQLKKEIGIRKILGASLVSNIMFIVREFIVLALVGCLIALPVAILFSQNWLDIFQYRISINTMTFILPVFFILIISMVIIAYQTLKLAFVNPIEILRTE